MTATTATARCERSELGELLVRSGELSPQELYRAHQIRQASRDMRGLEDILIEEGFCPEDVVDRAARALIEMQEWRKLGEWAPY